MFEIRWKNSAQAAELFIVSKSYIFRLTIRQGVNAQKVELLTVSQKLHCLQTPSFTTNTGFVLLHTRLFDQCRLKYFLNKHLIVSYIISSTLEILLIPKLLPSLHMGDNRQFLLTPADHNYRQFVRHGAKN